MKAPSHTRKPLLSRPAPTAESGPLFHGGSYRPVRLLPAPRPTTVSVAPSPSVTLKLSCSYREAIAELSWSYRGTIMQLSRSYRAAVPQPALRSPIGARYAFSRKINGSLVGSFFQIVEFCMGFVEFLAALSRRAGLLPRCSPGKGVEFCTDPRSDLMLAPLSRERGSHEVTGVSELQLYPTKPLVDAAPRASLAPFTSPFPMEAC
jgi:hypothetical protein